MTIPNHLPVSSPEAQGIPSSAILDFVQAADAQINHLHSFILLRHGHQVAQGWWHPYTPEQPHMLFSLSKSFTATAVGLAVDEGRISIDDPVISFFPDQVPARPSANLAAMRIRHLLSMVTGQAADTVSSIRENGGTDWVRGFLAQPVENSPGAPFVYNSGATYMLSAIVQKMTGQTLLDYLRPRLFDPLGIENPTWESCPRGINVGGWGLSIPTDAIARFGQLYLQQGRWGERQLVPAAWVAAATARQAPNGEDPESDWSQGYGYQFWRCRHNVYRGDGAFGQFCIVMPDQDAVLAITSGTANMQAVLNLVWEHLLPAMGRASLPPAPDAETALTNRLTTLALPLPQGKPTSPLASRLSSQCYHFPENESGLQSMTVDFTADGLTLTTRSNDREFPLVSGHGHWVAGIAPLGERGSQPMVSAGGWTDDQTYVLQSYFTTTPFCRTTTCHFDGDRLTYNTALNVSFGPTDSPPLIGQMRDA